MTAFRYAVLASTTALALAACGGTGAPEAGSSPPVSEKATDSAADTGADAGPATTGATTQAPGGTCVSEAYASLTEDQRLGQLLMVGFDTNAPLSAQEIRSAVFGRRKGAGAYAEAPVDACCGPASSLA